MIHVEAGPDGRLLRNSELALDFFSEEVLLARRVWDGRLVRRSAVGEDYLRSRAIEPSRLLDRDAVRFDAGGAPAVALHHLAVGAAVINVVRRNLPAEVDAGRPKIHSLGGCSTSGALVGSVDDISSGSDVVVCEGVIDSLAAVLAWPEAVVCGAHGAGRMPQLAAEVAARVAAARSRLFLVHDNDLTGIRRGADAVRAALAAGLRLDRDLVVIDLEGAHDLADAWRSGWAP